MNKLIFVLLTASISFTVGAATLNTSAPKPLEAKKTVKPYGLTESMAVQLNCPDARFEGANSLALGGVLLKHKGKLDAAPPNEKMELMTRLVEKESKSASEFARTTKLDCLVAPELAATYWNRLIKDIAESSNNSN
jgi:hypothetical protein